MCSFMRILNLRRSIVCTKSWGKIETILNSHIINVPDPEGNLLNFVTLP